MAQLSFPWPGDSGAGGTGDCGPYSANAFSDWLEKLFTSSSVDESVIPNIGNELAVTGSATPLSVNTGAAIVNGKHYNNSAAVSLAISTPVGATRVDRVILRADYAAQTVRLVLLAGAEGGSAPALTQTDGTTWEASLAQASITTGGVVTVTDERVFLHFNTDIETAMIEDSAVTAAKIANRTRAFMVHATCYNSTDAAVIGASNGSGSVIMPDNKTCYANGSFFVPTDYVSGMTIKPVLLAAGNGDLYASAQAAITAIAGTVPEHTDVANLAANAMTSGILSTPLTITASSVAAGDVVGCYFTRVGTNAADTIGAEVEFYGFLVSYTADS